MTHIESKEKKIGNMKKPFLVLGLLFLAIGVLFGVKTMVSTRIITSGVELGKLQDETQDYKTQNTILKEKIYSLSSLTHVSESASKVGFVESKSTFAVTQAHPIASAQ